MARTRRDLERLGRAYRKERKGFLPDRVQRSGRKQKRKALEALGDGAGWLSRLAMAGENLHLCTITLKSLGLERFEDETHLYDHDAVAQIVQAVHKAMPSAFWARLEVGNRQRKLHVHVVAHQLPTVIHHARPEKEFEGGLMDIASYVTKCPVPGDNLSAGIFLEAQRLARTQGHSRLPATAFKRGIPNN
jgi:hypothetical protein